MKPITVSRQVREQARKLGTLLNVFIAGVALTVLVNLYLLAQMVVAWQAARTGDQEALNRQTIVMKTAEIAARPLEGLDAKLAESGTGADQFYARRLPAEYSQVVGELGILAKKDNVRLTGVNYAPSEVIEDPALTQVQMDARLSGDYRPLVLFMNGLERDRMFFLITGLTLTGQQTGTVGLRVRLVTYLRAPASGDLGPARDVVTAPVTDSRGGAQ